MGEAALSALAGIAPTMTGSQIGHYTGAVGERGEMLGDEAELLARLRAGDEEAFRELVRCHDGAMRRIARSYVQTVAVADDVVQETWLAVIRGLAQFEGRSSLKTWIFRILVNRAQTRGVRERRLVPFSSLAKETDDEGGVVDADRFLPAGHPVGGYWTVAPNRFFELPEERLLADEATHLIARAIQGLPQRQRRVIELRDVEGWGAEEVCESLGLSQANQRVLLHRARSAVRAILEEYFVAEVVEA
ncbi:MAG: RNA polymerase sigma factor [Solirubrobacteraceae bacterium]